MEPTLEIVERYARDPKVKRVPVSSEILSDYYTTIEVMRILRNVSKNAYLLESASQDKHFGRYSFLGFEPSMEITCLDYQLRIRKRQDDNKLHVVMDKAVSHPGEEIRKILEENFSPRIEELPTFTGGLVGYFSYDYIKYSEPKLKLKGTKQSDRHNKEFKDIDLMLFNDVIAFDHYRQKLIFITGINVDKVRTVSKNGDENQVQVDHEKLELAYEEARTHLKELIHLIHTGQKKKFKSLAIAGDLKLKYTEEQYVEMVEKAKHYIKEGDIFQVVLSNPLTVAAEGSLFDTYRVLRTENPSPYMFYFSSSDMEMAGASPETLAKVEDQTASTFPLAGTRRRGQSDEEDERIIKDLLSDEKELAEHNMLVDLGRNDMGKISKIGTVQVEKYLEIQMFSHVMHIGSTVTGEVAKGKDAIDVMDAILPAGTLSGAPKFRACQIIDELEKSKRGVYGGAIGYLDFTGNMDTCIAIRLVYKKNGEICIRSGAGIVADSNPKSEYEECRKKAQAVVNAIQVAEGGLR